MEKIPKQVKSIFSDEVALKDFDSKIKTIIAALKTVKNVFKA